jgi:hypothetical protein
VSEVEWQMGPPREVMDAVDDGLRWFLHLD